jgi:plasmid stability protein
MTMTITLEGDLATALKDRAAKQHLSAEQLAIHILTDAMARSDPFTPSEVVAQIQATVPNPSSAKPGTANLADLLHAAPGDPSFDLESWNRHWSAVEAELKAITRANDRAEGRGWSA